MSCRKIPGLMLFFILLLIPACSAGSVPALDTTALTAQPYITLDPVGDHTLDEVFFISGTTNLPALETPLLLQIYSADFNPGGGGSTFQSNVTIEPGMNGINYLSCNVTTNLWQTYGIGPRFRVTPGAVPGEYLVMVVSQDPRTSATATRIFSILPSEDTGSTAASPGLTPSPTITVVRVQVGYGISDSPTSVQNSSQGTAAPTGNPPQEVPTTHPAPLLPAVSVAAAGLGLIVIQRSGKS